jgi:hypothetical protein
MLKILLLNVMVLSGGGLEAKFGMSSRTLARVSHGLLSTDRTTTCLGGSAVLGTRAV